MLTAAVLNDARRDLLHAMRCMQVQLTKVAIGSRPKLLWPLGGGAGSPASGDPETPTGGGESGSSSPSSQSKRPLLG